jgi:hypothetical protein
MVAIQKNVQELGRKSGYVSVLAGLIIVCFFFASDGDATDRSYIERIVTYVQSWSLARTISMGLGILALLSTSYLMGPFVGYKALISLPRAFVWSVLSSYLDLVFGIAALYLFSHQISALPSEGLFESFLILFGFSAIYAFIPILFVSILRALWLRRQFNHERVLW